MKIDYQTVLRTFQGEAAEHLDAIEDALVALEARPGDHEPLQAAFRAAHTLKGAARCVELEDVVALAHRIEDAFERLRDGGVALEASLASLLLKAVDALRFRVASALDRPDVLVDTTALSNLERWLEGGPAGPGAPSPKALEPAPQAPPVKAEARGRSLRVGIDKLDRMLDLMGEIAVARGRLSGLLEGGLEGEAARDAHRDADRFYMELQELVMQARMVPLDSAFRPQVRALRDLAVSQGKQICLVTEGGEVEVDTAIIEGLRDPLTHLVRNAVDHGIEAPEERRRLGKEPAGTVRLRAAHEHGRIVVEVSDDGAGLDADRIAAVAREHKVCAEPERLSREELFRLILLPGFSTASKVTEVSGRGVGMDVVRRNIDALHGSLAITSEPGKGTRFVITLPLTLAIVDGFAVGAAGETYVLPIEAVVECVELPRAESMAGRATGVLGLRGSPLPYLRLRDFFGLPGGQVGRESVVVIRHGDGVAGLAVDELKGEGQTVIKPLSALFRRVPGISGSALLGDGRVALILDIANLMRAALASMPTATEADRGPSPPQAEAGAAAS